MAIRIEKADATFLPQMAALHHASFDEDWNEQSLGDLLVMPGAINLIAFRDDSPDLLGFILMRAAADEAEIITIAVDPSVRKQGIGRELLKAGVKAVQSMGTLTVFLEVAEDNEAAIALYERHGFAVTGRRPGYYRRGLAQIDAAVMRLDCAADE